MGANKQGKFMDAILWVLAANEKHRLKTCKGHLTSFILYHKVYKVEERTA
jgi:hypothetical protein